MRRFLTLALLLSITFTLSAESVKVFMPGTLSTLITNPESITELHVSGKINGTDVAFIREMAGSDVRGNATAGKLQTLDLSEARIVAGGDAYYQLDLEAPEGMKHSAMELSRMMGVGWNVGNSLEVPVNSLNAETAWGNARIRQKLIDAVRDAGFNSVRIPTSWFVHAVNGNTIDPDWIERVKEVVDYCINDGLFVILNCHYDNNWLQTKGFTDMSESNIATVEQRQYDIWHQVATSFKDYDEHLMFAGTNEPGMNSGVSINAERQAALDRYLQAFVNAVRDTGGNNLWRTLIVQSWGAEIPPALNYSKTLPTDPTPGRMMFEAHCYDPTLFGLFDNDQSWGKLYYYWGNGNHNPSSSRNTPSDKEEQYLEDLMESLYQRFVKQGIPLIIGEYGANWRDLSGLEGESQELHEKSLADYYYAITNSMLKRNIVPFVWDNGATKRPTFALFNRARAEVSNSFSLEGIMRAKQEQGVPVDVEAEGQTVPGSFCTADDVIGDNMFAGCTSLRELTLPNRIASIGNSIVDGCTALNTLVCIAGEVPACGKNAFDDKAYACQLSVPEPMLNAYKTNAQWKNFANIVAIPVTTGSAQLQIDLGEGERLSDYLANTRIYHINNNILSYEESMFGVTQLTVSGTLNGTDYLMLTQMAGVNADGTLTNGQLTTLNLKDTQVTEGGNVYAINAAGEKFSTRNGVFPEYVFNRTKLSTITLPSQVETIGRAALSYSSQMRKLTISDGPTEIADSAFASIPEEMENVVVPNSVRLLGSRCFMDGKFKTFTVGTGVTEIGSQALRGCQQLSNITVCTTVPPQCAADAFRFVDKTKVTVTVPAGSLTAYQTAPVWQDFVLVEGDITSIVDISNKMNGNQGMTYDLSGRVASGTERIHIKQGKKHYKSK